MSSNQHSSKDIDATIELVTNETFSVRANRGATLRCEAGMVWVTQEGDWRDYLLPAGVSFVAKGNGLIVVNGRGAHNRVLVCLAPLQGDPAWRQRALRYDARFIAGVAAHARRARTEFAATALRCITRHLVLLWRRALRRITARRRHSNQGSVAC